MKGSDEVMEKRNNAGLTMVELLISIAILGIVGMAVFGFIVTSSKVYGKEVTKTDLQYEAQLVINQLQDMLIDATDSVVYEVTLEDDTEQKILNEEGIEEDKISEKNLYIYNAKEYYKITWDRVEERLYYTRYIKNSDWEIEPNANKVRMADYVKGFRADITRLKEDRSVGFDFLFSINGIDYATAHNITLRNRSASGADSDGSIVDKEATQDKITITPTAFVLWPGDSVNFTHSITSNNGGYPSQDADWTLTSDHALAPGTILRGDGILEVDMDETNSSINVWVTARYGKENEDGSIYKPSVSAVVHVKQVEGIGVGLMEGGSYAGLPDQRLIPGSTMHFAANSISGRNIMPSDLSAGTIKWYMEKGGEYASVDENGMVSISESAPVDTVIQVKAGFNRAGREWAYGYSIEYKVVPLKEKGIIYVNDDDGEYMAPEGELWFPEQQKISMDWERIPAEFKNPSGTALKAGFQFRWIVTLNDGDEYDHMGIVQNPFEGNTQAAYLILGLNDWMQWNSAINTVTITLIIYSGGYYENNIVFRSNTITLEIPKAHYKYSYTKEGPFVDELSAFVTNETQEAHIYYYVYGYGSDKIQPWESFDNPDNGWYKVTNVAYYAPYKELGWKILNPDTGNKVIYFKPETTAGIGVSLITHRIWADYDTTKLIVNFNKANIRSSGTGYYVPLPGTEAYRDSGYLYGDCSFHITAEKTLKGSIYYKLVITDKSGETEKKIIGYYKNGDTKWGAEEPYKD